MELTSSIALSKPNEWEIERCLDFGKYGIIIVLLNCLKDLYNFLSLPLVLSIIIKKRSSELYAFFWRLEITLNIWSDENQLTKTTEIFLQPLWGL